jgi:hypothetical protein
MACVSLTEGTTVTNLFLVLQVWDVNVIETAMKDFYGNDQSTMIQAIQQNITVRTHRPGSGSLILPC